MSLARVGPVEFALADGRSSHYNPAFAWASDVRPQGSRPASISGLATWQQAQQLSELVENPKRQINVGGDVGVLEYVHTDDPLLGAFRGWYLLQSFDLNASQQDSLAGITGAVPFSISAVYLGDQRQVTMTHSARAKDNDFDLTPRGIVVDPMWNDDSDAAASFVTRPGGRLITREYDASFPYVSAADAGESRLMAIYESRVS